MGMLSLLLLQYVLYSRGFSFEWSYLRLSFYLQNLFRSGFEMEIMSCVL